jgi:two-component system, OmpR family, sensor kinase
MCRESNMGLRGRLILSFVLVVVICIGVIAITLSVQSEDTLERLAEVRLSDMSLPLLTQVRSLLRGQSTLDQVWQNLEEQSKATGISIFLCDRDGKIIRQTVAEEGGSALPPALFNKKPGILPRSISGTFTEADGDMYLYRAFPVSNIAKIKETGADWLVMTISSAGTVNILADLARPILFAGLIALIVSIIIALLLARSFYTPVRRVTQAASEMAKGKYEQEVPVEGPAEVRELATSFNDMSKQVKNSQQTLRDFVADVSHELRTPLTSINGFAQAIRDGTAETPETSVKAAGIIQEESKRMIRLVNNLLELSRLEAGQVEIKKEPVDLKEVIQQCQEVFSLRAEEKKLFLVTDMEPLARVMGDIDRLEQVFGNLLDNAIKHTPEAGSVTIRGRQASAEAVEISVIDSGNGLTAEQLPHIFERFYHGNGAGNRSGTGLGLAISRQIVLSHGGEIRVSSQAGNGAEFTVKLPAMHEPRDEGKTQLLKGRP